MFDTERLISAVEERRCLWDASHEDYKNRDKRLKGWKEVAEDIVPDYGDMEEGEQKQWGKYSFFYCKNQTGYYNKGV